MSQKYAVGLSEALDNKRIQAIKNWRITFDLGLREAKDAIDDMQYGNMAEYELTSDQVESLSAGGFVLRQLSGVMPRRVTIYTPDDGKKINAIKNLRRASGYLGLKEAKDIIDEMWTFNRPIEIKSMNEMFYIQLIEAGFTVQGFVLEMFKENEDLFRI